MTCMEGNRVRIETSGLFLVYYFFFEFTTEWVRKLISWGEK